MIARQFIYSALLFACALLAGCGPSAEKRAEERRVHCLNNLCEGDVLPKYDFSKEQAFKVDGRWFVGPREYVGYGGRIGFEWWNHKPLSPSKKRPPEVQALVMKGKSGEITIDISFRNNNIPSEPRGYQRIELAVRNDRILERRTIRPGLEVFRIKHEDATYRHLTDHFNYYVATNLVGADGSPPVASCNHRREDGSGGTGFMWKPGIWAQVRMNQRHCIDWPEIYTEVKRILELIREV